MDDDAPQLSLTQAVFASRAANEGIPIGAISRILQTGFDTIVHSLRRDKDLGLIGTVPRADWPPGQHWDARLPSCARSANVDDVTFACRQVFKLTNLEAGFLLVLLRYQCAEKFKLHTVIEQHRTTRAFRPNAQETTDPKMVDVMICKLRKKLREYDDTIKIETAWGKGYYIEPDIKDAIYTHLGVNHGFEPEDGRAEFAAPAG